MFNLNKWSVYHIKQTIKLAEQDQKLPLFYHSCIVAYHWVRITKEFRSVAPTEACPLAATKA